MKLKKKKEAKKSRVKKRRIDTFVNKKMATAKQYKEDQTANYKKQRAYFSSEEEDPARWEQQYTRDQQFLQSLFNLKMILLFVVIFALYKLLTRT